MSRARWRGISKTGTQAYCGHSSDLGCDDALKYTAACADHAETVSDDRWLTILYAAKHTASFCAACQDREAQSRTPN